MFGVGTVAGQEYKKKGTVPPKEGQLAAMIYMYTCMCMYVCMYVYTCMHAYIHTCMHAYILNIFVLLFFLSVS